MQILNARVRIGVLERNIRAGSRIVKMVVTLAKASLAVLALTACTSSKIIIDRKGVDPEQYSRDLAECEQYADEVEAPTQIAKSAGVGAAVGGAIGAVMGNSEIAKRTAGAGAVKGATHGGLEADAERKRVVKRCLSGRGYKVLN